MFVVRNIAKREEASTFKDLQYASSDSEHEEEEVVANKSLLKSNEIEIFTDLYAET